MSGKPSSESPAEQKPARGVCGRGLWMVHVQGKLALAVLIVIILAVPA